MIKLKNAKKHKIEHMLKSAEKERISVLEKSVIAGKKSTFFSKNKLVLVVAAVFLVGSMGVVGYTAQQNMSTEAFDPDARAAAIAKQKKAAAAAKKKKAALAARDRAQANTQKAKATADRKAAAKKAAAKKAAAAKKKAALAARDRAQARTQQAKATADRKAAAKKAAAKKAAAAAKKRAAAARDRAQANTEKARSAANQKAAAVKKKAAQNKQIAAAARDRAQANAEKARSAATKRALAAAEKKRQASLAKREQAQVTTLKAKSVADRAAAVAAEKRFAEILKHDEALSNTLKAKSTADQKAAVAREKAKAKTVAESFSLLYPWSTTPKSKSKTAPAPLGKESCLIRGFSWVGDYGATSPCQETCKKDTGKIVKAKYNYCSNTVTTSIRKSDCKKLGRKWLVYNGCARHIEGRSAALQCSDTTENYVGGSKTRIDYCGGKETIEQRKAIAAKVVLKSTAVVAGQVGQVGLVSLPVGGPVTADMLDAHGGAGAFTGGGSVDIGMANGTRVLAIFGGTVSNCVDRSCYNAGLVITSRIQGGILKTAYAHGTSKVANGSSVASGSYIMASGERGNSGGPHLHVDMTFNGKRVCPQDVFRAKASGNVNMGGLVERAKSRSVRCG